VALIPPGSTTGSLPVATGIAESPEARDVLVRSWYVTYLGRQAQGGEEQGWVNMLLQGQSEEFVLSNILATPEFFQRAQTLVSTGTPDERYVQALYQLLLNRTPDANELAGWVNNLASLGQQGVALSFLTSGEFRADQFEGYYNALLHRPSDPGGTAYWVSTGLSLEGVRLAFETGSEFFAVG
jgi:hypothetical protein